MHRITITYDAPADPAAFDAHYRDTHVPIASRAPGVRRYLVSHPRGLGSDAPYLVAELWFDDAESMKAALKSPEMAEATRDAATFDVGSMVIATGEVEDVLPGS